MMRLLLLVERMTKMFMDASRIKLSSCDIAKESMQDRYYGDMLYGKKIIRWALVELRLEVTTAKLPGTKWN